MARKGKSGLKSSINVEKDWPLDNRLTLYQGQRWKVRRIVKLLAEQDKTLDQVCNTVTQYTLTKSCTPVPTEAEKEIFSLYHDLRREFERALETGDADWFVQMEKGVKESKSGKKLKTDRFEARVYQLLDQSVLFNKKNREDTTLVALSGKTAAWSAPQIFSLLHQRELPDGTLVVEGRKFRPKPHQDRVHTPRHYALDAIRKIATRYRVTLPHGERIRCTSTETPSRCRTVAVSPRRRWP